MRKQPSHEMWPRRLLAYTTARTTAVGERHGIDWLTYNPLQMLQYHRMALEDAAGVVATVLEIFPEPTRMADVGCGSGAFAAEFRRRGRSVVACEHALGGRLVARFLGVPVTTFDLNRQPPARFAGGVELAYCFEVAEHCTPVQGDHLVAFLAKLAPLVVFSAARPGQGGLGHINEQEPEYWIQRFAVNGATLAGAATEALRAGFPAAGVGAPWFEANTLVFSRGGEKVSAFAEPSEPRTLG